MRARLVDPWFEAEFIGNIATDSKSYRRQGASIEGAQGLLLWCPCGYGKAEYPLDGGRPHACLIPFANPRGAALCPPAFGPVARKHKPDSPDVHPRWTMSGDGLENLTITPSVDVGGDEPGSSCWHGFITAGVIT